MTWNLGQLLRRLRAIVTRRTLERDLDDEMRFHLEMQAAQHESRGTAPHDARTMAVREFGGVAFHKEEVRDARGLTLIDDLSRDSRFAARMLRRNPGFTLVAVCTLALGIGATTTVFSVVNTVLLQPLPYNQPDRLIDVSNHWEGRRIGGGSVSPAEYFDYRDQLRAFEQFGVYASGIATITGDGEAERVQAAAVSAGALDALGVRPAFGRLIDVRDDTRGSDDVVLLTDALWRRRFGALRDVVGKRINIDGRPLTVIGIMPPGFRMPEDLSSANPAELITPLALMRDSVLIRGGHYLSAIGRLKSGVNTDQAGAELRAISTRFATDYPSDYPTAMHFTAAAEPMQESVVGNVRSSLLLLLGAVSIVLVIACVNAASLMLARGETRRQEIAVRTALGAARTRLLRQLLVENLALALLAGVAGVALALAGTRALAVLHPANFPRLAELSVDGRVMLFALAITVACGLAFGTMPALQSVGGNVQDALRSGGRGATMGAARRRMRHALVVSEIALAMVLLLGASLLTKSFFRLLGVDPGFKVERVLTVPITLPVARYRQDESVISLFRQLTDRVRPLPGVRAVGAVAGVPLVAPRGDMGLEIEGRPIATGATRPKADWQVVTPGYFRAIGMKLLRGREIEESDLANTPGVVVINESMAKKYWPGEDALGRRFKLGGGARPGIVTVVGVMHDVHQAGLGVDPGAEMYLAHTQFRFWGGGAMLRSLTLVVSTTDEPTRATPAVREALKALDPDLPVGTVRTMEQVRGESVARPRFMMYLLTTASGVAFLIAVLGLYGIVAYSVARRSKEFGVRIALGARPGDITGLVLREGILITIAGIAIGLPAAIGLARLLSGFLFEVRTTDPVLLVGIPCVLAIVAAVASYVPARRATRADPVSALRAD